MNDKEFKCRKKEISGVTYRLIFRKNDNFEASTDFENIDQAFDNMRHMSKALPDMTFEMSSYHWTNEVCVECGRD